MKRTKKRATSKLEKSSKPIRILRLEKLTKKGVIVRTKWARMITPIVGGNLEPQCL